jgi:hypothetical protein
VCAAAEEEEEAADAGAGPLACRLAASSVDKAAPGNATPLPKLREYL